MCSIFDEGIKIFFLKSPIILIDQIFQGLHLKSVGESDSPKLIDARTVDLLGVLIQISQRDCIGVEQNFLAR